MSRFRKFLGFLPVFMAYFMSDKTWVNFALMMIAGLIFWIPYWLAWWLSDGFNIFNTPCNYNDDDFQWLSDEAYGYRSGQEGFGYYVGDECIHH